MITKARHHISCQKDIKRDNKAIAANSGYARWMAHCKRRVYEEHANGLLVLFVSGESNSCLYKISDYLVFDISVMERVRRK